MTITPENLETAQAEVTYLDEHIVGVTITTTLTPEADFAKEHFAQHAPSLSDKRHLAGTSQEAALLAKEIGANLVISCDYGMFEFNTVSPEGFVHAVKEVNQPYRVLKCGERLSLGTS